MRYNLLLNKYVLRFIIVSFSLVLIIFSAMVYKIVFSGINRVTEEWLIDNLYRVETFSKVEDTNYYNVTLVKVEPALVEDFESLKEIFNSTPYTLTNSFYLKDGVNCQGMTCYIVDWCKRNNISFSLKYTRNHVSVIVNYEQNKYEFSFSAKRYIELLEEELQL